MMSNIKITQDAILFCNKYLKPDKALDYANALENARQIANLNTARRVRHFLAQTAHETGGFRSLVESFYWSDPRRLDDTFSAVVGLDDAKALIAKGPEAIANRVYANRLGNGDEASGEGSRYKGRGFFQLTGKDNYRKASSWSGFDLVKEPGLAGQAKSAGIIAAKYWTTNSLNSLADQGDLEAITRAVNGPGMAGLADRKIWLSRLMKQFPD